MKRFTRIGALDSRAVPALRPRTPATPRIAPVAIRALSTEDEDRLFAYQNRPRTRGGLLQGLVPPGLRARHSGASPHRLSRHLFCAMGVVPTRTASEAIFEVLLSTRVLSASREVGNLDNLDRALANLQQLDPAQRERVASIAHAFAAQAARRRGLEFKAEQTRILIDERQAHCRRVKAPNNADRVLVELRAELARVKAMMRARPSEFLPPPAYHEVDLSPPSYDGTINPRAASQESRHRPASATGRG